MFCKFCNKEFKPSPKTGNRQKYCSQRCREKDWIKNNPERWAKSQKKARHKQPLYCRFCKKEIPLLIRRNGLVFCSDDCRKKSRKAMQKKRRNSYSLVFSNYKLERGCCICGYDRNSCSLDFHHVDPSKKELRITDKHFILNTEKIKNELSKCILVCKNCHYELHDLFRINIEGYWKMMQDLKIAQNGNVAPDFRG